jgi:hypothetical protein
MSLKRTPFKRKPPAPYVKPERIPQTYAPLTVPVRYPTFEKVEQVGKAERLEDGTKAAQDHKAKLAAMSCVICERIIGQHPGGNVHLHHLRTGGWGKGDWRTLIPLCYTHHQGAVGIHTMGTKAWERHFDVSQKDLLELTNERADR